MAPPSSSPRLALLALAAAAVVLAALPAVHAHGFMSMPASRNYIHSTYYPRTAHEKSLLDESYFDYCPHCLAAGGPGAVSNLSKLEWPVGLNGLCGDKYYVDGTGPPVDTAREHEAGGRFATGGGASKAQPLGAATAEGGGSAAGGGGYHRFACAAAGIRARPSLHSLVLQPCFNFQQHTNARCRTCRRGGGDI